VRLKERPIDLVTLAVTVPGLSGLETLQEIRRPSPNVDVIVITERGTQASALAALRCGAAGYLIKPFNAMELVRLVVQLTQKKQALASTLREELSPSSDLRKAAVSCRLPDQYQLLNCAIVNRSQSALESEYSWVSDVIPDY
jgi:DNA-binding response OmpR family regulator